MPVFSEPEAPAFQQQTVQPWMDRAACVGANPELWFPLSTSPTASKLALKICSECPVRAHCREWGDRTEHTSHGNVWGILGGETARERVTRRHQKHKTNTNTQDNWEAPITFDKCLQCDTPRAFLDPDWICIPCTQGTA